MSVPVVLHGEPVRVRVPATSANLGPGFDSLGLALGLYDDLEAQLTERRGVRVTVTGEGAGTVPADGLHLVAVAMRATFDRLGVRPAGFDLAAVNRIPHGRGLGSSAAAIVAGVRLARAMVVDGDARLDDDDALDLAGRLEGHPDNVAAALLGGLTVAWTDDDGTAHAVSRPVHPDVVPVVCVPSTEVATSTARALLPAVVPHADAVFNVSRAALLVTALTSDPTVLLAATADRLHQPYRAETMPASAALVSRLRLAGLPAVVSGAGPTVLVLASPTSAPGVAAMAEGFAVHALPVHRR